MKRRLTTHTSLTLLYFSELDEYAFLHQANPELNSRDLPKIFLSESEIYQRTELLTNQRISSFVEQ